MALRYRLAQLAAALKAQVTPEERALLAQLLNPEELRLFERMAQFDQRHCLDVYHTLVKGNHTDPHLLRAALLHDCGKVADDGRPIPLLYYGLFVVLMRLAPAVYRWAAASGRGVLWPFAVHAVHEQRSALLASRAGSAPEVVRILNDYAQQIHSPSTAALQWADALN